MTANTIPYHQKELEKLFIYNPINGKLFNKIARGKARKGMEAGSPDGKGYRRVRLDGGRYLVHRIIWKMVTGTDPAEELDHISHDPSDNRMDNLREATRTEQNQNLSKAKNNTSGVTGVSWDKTRGKWQSIICVEGKNRRLGYFTQRWHAIRARKLAEIGYNFHPNHGL